MTSSSTRTRHAGLPECFVHRSEARIAPGRRRGRRSLGSAISVVAMGLLALSAALEQAQAHQSGAPQAAAGQSVAPAARTRIERLTLDLVQLSAQYQAAPAARKPQLEQSLLASAKTREQELLALIELEPAEVLRLSIPNNVRARMPLTVQTHVEEETTVDGTLEVLHEDGANYSRFHYGLMTARGRLSLYFAQEDGPDMAPTGSRIRVKGVRVGQTLAAGGSNTGTVQVLSAAVPNTFGAQRTLVILVNFEDNPVQPYTVNSARDVLFTTTSDFFLENSYGQTWLTGDVVGWYTIALSSTVCDYSAVASQAKQAATSAGVRLTDYARYVYAFPQNACYWWGLGTVGGNPSQAWVNGKLELGGVGHELGHNLGLYHSHGYYCSRLFGACYANEYGDAFDLMGNSLSNHFNSFQKERLGWLNYGSSPMAATATASGTYTIAPYEMTGGAKAVKVVQSVDPVTAKKTYYYLEYRRPIGFDSSVSAFSTAANGILVRTATESSPNSSYLLDLTLPTSPSYDPGLLVGQTYTDSAAGIAVTPTWADVSGAGVGIVLGQPECVHASPTLSISPAQSEWTAAGATVSYQVILTNNDSSACAGSSFAIQAVGPAADWSVSIPAPRVAAEPGMRASVTLSVTSPVTAPAGFYAVGVSAADVADATRSDSAVATQVISPLLDVAVVSDRSTYRPNQTATLTTTVKAGSAPVPGAAVTVTVARSDGTTTRLTATTDSAGVASVRYRLRKGDPSGTYEAISVAVQSNSAKGQGLATFVVQ